MIVSFSTILIIALVGVIIGLILGISLSHPAR